MCGRKVGGNMSDSRSSRVLGLTRRDRLTLFVIAIIFVSGVAGRRLVRRSRETVLPSRAAAAVRVDVNSAGRGELTLLPGIGDKTARLIIKDREENGPFGTVNDLSRVKGIGRYTIERIIPYAECR